MISLKSIRDQITVMEGYISTTDARNYIQTQGTCTRTTYLNGQPASYYRCNGSCSWTCSGSCSRAASGS